MRPVWSFKLERTTNAPLALVSSRLKDGERFRAWHPRHRAAVIQVIHEDESRVELHHHINHFLGVEELNRYVITRAGEGLLLTYEARFKGWPVLVMMCWWRIISDPLWERFVAHLPGGEA